MSVCSPVNLSSINAVFLKGRAQLLISNNICGIWSHGKPSSCSFQLWPGQSQINLSGLSVYTTSSGLTIMGRTIRGGCLGFCFWQRGNIRYFTSAGPRRRHLKILLACQSMNMRLLVPTQKRLPKVKCTMGPITWPPRCTSAGLIFGLLVRNFNSSSKPAHAEADCENENKKVNRNESCPKFSHGKEVYTDYSVIGIPGGGRCLFRSVAHGACLRSGKPPPRERLQRELADEWRARVADEFIKRREETEWFVEGDFDTYVSQIRKSRVGRMPIIVFMYDGDAGGLISIAEYDQEYGQKNPTSVLYHGFGHYDALEIHGRKGLKSKL